jgi:hypothetical protein
MTAEPEGTPVRRRQMRPSKAVFRRRRLVVVSAVLSIVILGYVVFALPSSGPARPSSSRQPAHTRPNPATSPPTWLAQPDETGFLQPGSDPSVLPGPILISDKANSRLLVVDAQGRIRWQFPQPGDLAPGESFLIPDDAFFSPHGTQIIATEEDDFVISVIDLATEKIVWRYGTPGVAGAGPNQLWNPDDAMLLPDGSVLSADIKNCRIILIAPGAHDVARQLGRVGACAHHPPITFGSPNGVFPMIDNHYLVTEINGDWVDELGLDGTLYWSTHPPGVAYPSDTNEIAPDRYLTVDYSDPGQIVIFNAAGQTLWRFAPSGLNPLNHPSLALPLPNGDILCNDDWNDRVIVVDPRTDQIVWQYGHTGTPGATPGYLHVPDGVDLLPPYSLLGAHA